MKTPITILTSIFPQRIEAQQKAVRSWQELGFKVISLNLAEEMKELKSQFRDIVFWEIDRHKNKKIGAKIYLNEFFAAIEQSPGCRFGIVNSDITFVAQTDFFDFVLDNTKASMIFGSRIDIDEKDESVVHEYRIGFDYFFFDRALIKLYPENEFCLGMPVWDYWFALIPLISGQSIKRLISPLAYHQKHENSWEHLDNRRYWKSMIHDITAIASTRNTDTPPIVTSELIDSIKYDYELAYKLIRYLPESITYTPNAMQSDNIMVNRHIFDSMKKEILATHIKTSEILKSRSWRLTRSLRYLRRLSQRVLT